MMRHFPVRWQARFWAWRCPTKIHAIKELRRTARLGLKEAKEAIEATPRYQDGKPKRCRCCGAVL